ncbi:MAG: tetratricopeptide repeat protein [Sediminibacterium sp.]|nr:tetratricopeptide repeat protein [Sediminibacterium sp.]
MKRIFKGSGLLNVLCKRSIFFLISLFFCGVSLFAQEESTSENIEQQTYQLYTNGDWKKLIQLGKEAIKQGHDYYYMQMRVGIAYYQLKNYCLAENYFKKALTLNNNDEAALEYLYFCYIFTGKNEHARWLSHSFSGGLAERTGVVSRKPIENIFVEGGTKLSDSLTYYDTNKKTNTIFFDPPTYLHAGLTHYIKNRVAISHAATYFSQKTFIGNLVQSEYYLKAALPLKGNWLLSPSIHWVNINFTSQVPVYPTPPRPPGPPTITNSVSVSNYFVGSAAIQKAHKRLTLSVGTSVSNLFDKTQLLHSAFASYAIFGNSSLVIGNTLYLHTNDSYTNTYYSLLPFVYVKPHRRISAKLTYMLNTGNNIIEDNGYFVNNSPDLTSSRYSGMLNVTISKHLDVYGIYQLEFKQESIQKFNYRYNILVGGIKYTF